METWQIIILLVLGGTPVLKWFVKSLIEKMLAKDLERFRASLNSEANSTIERLKHELQLVSLEHQVRFSKLHEKRAEVIAELYGLLVEQIGAPLVSYLPLKSRENRLS